MLNAIAGFTLVIVVLGYAASRRPKERPEPIVCKVDGDDFAGPEEVTAEIARESLDDTGVRWMKKLRGET